MRFLAPDGLRKPMNDGMRSTSAAALAAAGIAAAFALAACCALPVLFAGVALIFAPIALASEPHSQALTAISAIGLVGSVGMAAFAPRHCEANAVCARPWFRWAIFFAASAGLVLLVLAKAYA